MGRASQPCRGRHPHLLVRPPVPRRTHRLPASGDVGARWNRPPLDARAPHEIKGPPARTEVSVARHLRGQENSPGPFCYSAEAPMPHGELEIVISGDPPLSTVATVLETAESIYERLYIITHSPGSSRGDFAARLKTPREFIPDEDRLRITVLERASLLMLLHGFLPVLTGLATVLGLLLAYSELRRRLAEARKLTAETEKLRAETMQILQQITADGRALETSDVRAWMVFAVDTHQKLHGVICWRI